MLKPDEIPSDPLWVFGYGSLLWEPGFDYTRAELARMEGFRRSFCMRSIHHRGTPEHHGLVLALDAEDDASCEGMAFAVPQEAAQNVLDYLRARELISSAYLETVQPTTLNDGSKVQAVTYVIDTDHDQYCHYTLEEQAQIIKSAIGGRGPNTEYLFKTAAQLRQLGLHDEELDWLEARVREL